MALAEAAWKCDTVRTEHAGKVKDFTMWKTHLEIASPRARARDSHLTTLCVVNFRARYEAGDLVSGCAAPTHRPAKRGPVRVACGLRRELDGASDGAMCAADALTQTTTQADPCDRLCLVKPDGMALPPPP